MENKNYAVVLAAKRVDTLARSKVVKSVNSYTGRIALTVCRMFFLQR